jgi:uncharacterized protein (TIGR02147 family)
MLQIQKVRVFEYDNYRKFLEDTYIQSRSLDRKFSFRYFARAAGYKSPSIFLELIKGKKNLSPKGILKIAQALKLNPEETVFFKNLVHMNQANTAEERIKYTKEVSRSKTYRKIHPLSDSQYRFFNHWYVTAVREVVNLPGFNEDPAWIAKRVIPNIKPQQAAQALDDLLKLGLLKRDDEGRLKQVEAFISTPDEVSSAYVTKWHQEYLKRASESIESVPREKRDISAVYFTVDRRNLKQIKEMVQKFRKEVLALAGLSEAKNAVYQLNMQLFPIAELEEHEEEP